MFPVEQWGLPVSFSADQTKLVTLHEYLTPGFASIPVENLTLPQRIQIAVQRIQLQPESDLATINDGILGKARMIQEIQAGTDLGASLLEIEQEATNLIIAAARKE
jgi:hypothetical protein